MRGIARALVQDILRRDAVQGASTITQQFVKNALAAQNQRTLFQKLREATLAYHLNRKWDKEKILTEYLNAVYFGNGAYGIESAARTYFKTRHPGCGDAGHLPCASVLTPAESALLAGMVASPTRFDPAVNPQDSKERRDIVLLLMYRQNYISRTELEDGRAESLPSRNDLRVPEENSPAPHFTTWVKEQVIRRYGASRALNGGLRIRTTLDAQLQAQATEVVKRHLGSPDGPAAALVVIDNVTGEVRAMVGNRPRGDLSEGSTELPYSYSEYPFNLATQGQRQPGSAFKVFVLAQALREGISPYSTWESRRKIFDVPGTDGQEKFVVRNYENQYSGVTTLANATAESDNSVYAEVGMKVGLAKIARLARQMGIRTPVSDNPAITLGALKQGVTPLDMAHAFQTLAAGGRRVSGSLAAEPGDPVGIREVICPPKRCRSVRNTPRRRRIVSTKLAEIETGLLEGVVRTGTGTAAATGGFAAGKTGTTENYGDAWFVGFNKRWTVAVWVGYPDRLRPMETEFNGGPVAGGTFPAAIWRDFILGANAIQDQREAERAAREGREYVPPDESSSTGAPAEGHTPAPQGEGAAPEGQAPEGDGGPQPSAPAPEPPGGGDGGDAPSSPSPGGGGGGGDGGPAVGGGTAPG